MHHIQKAYLIKEIDVKLINILVTDESAYDISPVCYHNFTTRMASVRKGAIIRTPLQTDFMRSYLNILKIP